MPVAAAACIAAIFALERWQRELPAQAVQVEISAQGGYKIDGTLVRAHELSAALKRAKKPKQPLNLVVLLDAPMGDPQVGKALQDIRDTGYVDNMDVKILPSAAR